MVYTKFKELDRQCIPQWYEKNERRRQRAEQKRRQEHEEQQKQQQQHKQLHFSSTALATGLEQNFGILSAKEAQTTTWTSSDPFDSIGNLELDSYGNLGIAESYTPCDFASLNSLAPSCDVSPYPQIWFPCASLPAQHSTEQASLNETNPSSTEELLPALDPLRRATGQLRLANPVISGTNASVVEVKDSSENSESSESCDVVETSDDSSGSDDDETDIENPHQEMVIPGSELTRKDPSGSLVPHILPESNTTAPADRESSSVAIAPCLNGPAKAKTPFGSLCELKEPQIANISLPTLISDHASNSGPGSHFVTCQKKRGGESTEGDHELRPAKRMRPRKVNKTGSSALPPRNLRALPSRVSAENSSNKLSNQIGTQPRRSARTSAQTKADSPMDLGPCGRDTMHPNGLLQLGLDNLPKTIIYKEAQRGPSLGPNHLPGAHDHNESCRLVPSPPITALDQPPTTCHNCDLSAKRLLRMASTLEALNKQLLGFIKNCAAERLPKEEKSTEKNEAYDATYQDCTTEVAVGFSHSTTSRHDDGSDDNANSINDSESDDQSDSDSSDHYFSPSSPEEKVNSTKRRRWTPLEERRLRAYIQEGKESSWIAKKLKRSEAGVTQHWVIMERQDRGIAK